MKAVLIPAMALVFSLGIINAQPFREGKIKHKDMWERLNLSDEQKEKVEALRLNHRKEMIDLKADLEKDMLELRELKGKKNFSRAEVIAAVEKINAAKNKISLSAANHKMDIYELLTEDQRETFRKFGPGMGEPGMYMKQHERGLRHQMMDED